MSGGCTSDDVVAELGKMNNESARRVDQPRSGGREEEGSDWTRVKTVALSSTPLVFSLGSSQISVRRRWASLCITLFILY
jgi:hypothetical protein